MDIRRVVGANIRRFRLLRGISQESLGLQVGLDQAYVSKLEGGARNPSVVLLSKIGAVLKVSVSELTADSKAEMPKNLIRGRHVRRSAG